jgi:lysophospholipid acyltransferase (LPLAT)-like uncharacterized protein
MKDFIYKNILPGLGWFAINSISRTIRIRTENEHLVDKLKENGQPFIYVFWHGRQFLLVRYFSNRNIAIMSSTSRDGLLQAKILKRFGYEIVYGSSAKSPIRALITAIQKMKMGHILAFAVDGPTGPIHKAKPGAIYIAKKMNACIIPVTFSVKPAVIMKSWDQYMLPKPFAHAILIYGNPFYPSKETDDETIQKECHALEKQLKQMTTDADQKVNKL